MTFYLKYGRLYSADHPCRGSSWFQIPVGWEFGRSGLPAEFRSTKQTRRDIILYRAELPRQPPRWLVTTMSPVPNHRQNLKAYRADLPNTATRMAKIDKMRKTTRPTAALAAVCRVLCWTAARGNPRPQEPGGGFEAAKELRLRRGLSACAAAEVGGGQRGGILPPPVLQRLDGLADCRSFPSVARVMAR